MTESKILRDIFFFQEFGEMRETCTSLSSSITIDEYDPLAVFRFGFGGDAWHPDSHELDPANWIFVESSLFSKTKSRSKKTARKFGCLECLFAIWGGCYWTRSSYGCSGPLGSDSVDAVCNPGAHHPQCMGFKWLIKKTSSVLFLRRRFIGNQLQWVLLCWTLPETKTTAEASKAASQVVKQTTILLNEKNLVYKIQRFKLMMDTKIQILSKKMLIARTS